MEESIDQIIKQAKGKLFYNKSLLDKWMQTQNDNVFMCPYMLLSKDKKN